MNLKKICLLIFLLFLNRLSLSDEIKKIEILGLDSVSRGTVLNYLPYEVGDEFNSSSSSTIIKSLYKTNLFEDIFVNFTDSSLKIKVVEKPTIKYFDFLNYKDGDVLDKEKVQNFKKISELDIGQIFNELKFNKLIKGLQSLYESKGFYNADLQIKKDIDSKNRVGIEIDIQEGERSLINSFTIKGNKFYTEDQITNFFNIGEPDFFIINFFTRKDEFSQNDFDAGIETLKKKYFDMGFLDFNIDFKSVDVDKEKNEINLLIEVSEGQRYQLNSIFFDGDDSFSEEKLRSTIELSKGDHFERVKLISGLEKIQGFYNNIGYAYADINSKIETLNNNLVNIQIELKKKNLVYVNRITIRGNTRTQDDVIRREFRVLEGQIYSKEQLDKSLSTIKRLGYFSDVKMDFLESPEYKDKVDIILDVTETKTGEISFGLSQSNQSGTAVNAGISQRNILGTGNTFNGNFSNSSAVKEISFFFKDPYFNERKHSISYGLFNKQIDGANLDVSSYKIDESGGTFGYGIPVDEESEVSANIKLANIDLLCGAILSSSGYELEQCSGDKNYDLTTSIVYSQNSLNDFTFPTDGKYTNINVTSTIPGSDFQYLSLTSNYKSYYPISDNLTFNFNTKISMGKGYGDDEFPFFKRYYGGGSTSVKGFDFNSLGPKYPNGISKGGELSYLSNIALISPLTMIEDSENMRIAGFVDFGSINESISELSINDFRASTGLAFTWKTPIGPLGIFYAQPLLKKNSDSVENLAFTLGKSF